MAAQTINVSGIAALRFVLSANTQFFFTNGVDGQKLRLTLQQNSTGGFTVSSGNCPGILQPATGAGQDTTQELVYDAVTNSWNQVPQGNVAGAGALQSFTTNSTIAWSKGVVNLTGSASITLTITNPVSGPPGVGNDGEIMWFTVSSAHTHKVTMGTTSTVNQSSTSIQVAGAAGNAFGLVAYGGNVYIISASGALTLS